MSSRRTEQPTPRRLRRARLRGEVAVSRDLTGAVAFLGGTAALAVAGPSLARDLSGALRAGLVRGIAGDVAPWPALLDAVALLARCALPPCAAALLGAVAAGLLQARGLFTLEPLRFRIDRLDPLRGLTRLTSADQLLAAALGSAKACVVLIAGWRLLGSSAAELARSPRLDPTGTLRLLSSSAVRSALQLGAIAAAFGVLDLALASRRLRKALMMTRDEVRREHRQDEGDPRHRAERRRLHRALATAAPLGRAACLVVNPTHVAVALEHARGSEDAPVVIAKATGLAAARLRREARRTGVPIVRDVALARALFRLADVGEEIPVELYEAAAAILVHVRGASSEVAP